MPRHLREIEIGDWYQTTWAGGRFEVVAIDEDSQTIDVQYFDGTLGEIDFDSWTQLEVQDADPPEDCSGAFDADRNDLNGFDLPNAGNGDPLMDIKRLLY